MVRVLAALHAVDYVALGLENYGKPGNYFSRQIGRWSKQYVAAKTDEIASMERLMEYLPANVPADETVVSFTVITVWATCYFIPLNQG